MIALILIIVILLLIYGRLEDIRQAIEYKGTMLDENHNGWLEFDKPKGKK